MRQLSHFAVAMFLVCFAASIGRGQETQVFPTTGNDAIPTQESTLEKLRDQIVQLNDRVAVLEEALGQAYPTNVSPGQYPGPYYLNRASGTHDRKHPPMSALPSGPSSVVSSNQFAVGTPVAQPPVRLATKWEYLTIGSANTNVTERFDELGSKGWELVASFSDSTEKDGVMHHHVFKRPIQ